MRSLFLVAAVLTSWASLALSQTVSGVITGTVKDQTEAVVVGANLNLINEATGARRTAVTTPRRTDTQIVRRKAAAESCSVAGKRSLMISATARFKM